METRPPSEPGLDVGPATEGPQRRCIVTREQRPKEAMVRFVVGPDGQVVPDVDGRLPGRGLWLSAERDVVNTACAKGFFAKAARAKVTVPDDLADRVETLLVRRCLDAIGLARRAGQAVAGFEKARAWLQSGKAGLVVTASDAGADGLAKLAGAATDLPSVRALDGTELGHAFGRDRSVHVVLAPGRLADRLRRDAVRLEGFRGRVEKSAGR